MHRIFAACMDRFQLRKKEDQVSHLTQQCSRTTNQFQAKGQPNLSQTMRQAVQTTIIALAYI